MILVTSKETGLPAYIWVKEMQNLERHGGASPYTRIYLQNDKMLHCYFLDVEEAPDEIKRKIREERLIPGREIEEDISV